MTAKSTRQCFIHYESNDKAILVGDSEIAKTTLLKILAGEMEPDEGTFKWGVTTSLSYFPKDNSEFFDGVDMNLVEWLRQYAPEDEQTETFYVVS